ncbi:MAG: fructose-1,6-bisphosphatase [Anaerovibrio sp.]|uniref:fructose-1,6-bisphosphatase n=1 Tax=Anaerovibrio sp. TaxID=1872532 RepID=UPI0025F07DCE|nr:fructose-1,6-bisphosphatase [Anaerovibrio sp.]MCR5175240.1 fructose-1,6-bisphosphatase [Anaerovibrio sp.]
MKAPLTSLQKQKQRYLRLLAEKYPTKEAVYSKLIHLQASLSLPKGVEHFLSDLHGEYELFYHIFNNCSGVIKEKVDYVFGARLTDDEKAEFCTLIYYPKDKIEQIKSERGNTPEWYRENLARLLEVTKLMSYKYPLAKVRSFIPQSYRTVITELMNTHPEADHAQFIYHKRLLNMIVQIDGATDFIIALTMLIKRLAVDHMHIVGDFFDRGNRPDAIMEMVMNYHSIDIQWGNHDVMWMGAACGSDVCIAGVVRNSLRYNNTDVLEKGYAISLRPLSLFAHRIYPDESPLKASEKAMSMIMFKLEGQLIKRNPDFQMDNRLMLEHVDYNSSCFKLNGKKYALTSAYFPTIDPKNPYELTEEEQTIMTHLKSFFTESENLRRHVDFLYKHGSVYTCFNGNLLFHGCVPLNEDGSFAEITFDGKTYKGRAYLDFVDQLARKAQSGKDQRALDFMWFLWSGRMSPISGREFRTFERMFLEDEETWKEPADPYYKLINREEVCEHILEEFGLAPEEGHIINGHVPVKVKKGETPVKANGKAIVIDGGFCRAYHNKTGISGYTLISNSRGLRLLEHQTVADVKEALKNNKDIESVSETIELQSKNTSVGDTDEGKIIQEEITDLYNLLTAYQNGVLKPQD